MPYINYTPNQTITKGMFDFDYFGVPNFKFSGTIRVSVSDAFSMSDYYRGNVNNNELTMDPLPNEIRWTAQEITNIENVLSLLSAFANLSFGRVIDYDFLSNGSSIVTPRDVANNSDINISLFYPSDSTIAGISSVAYDLFGYAGSAGDVFISYGAFQNEVNFFSEGSSSKETLMHEILHSIGLSHPHASSNGARIIKPDYAALRTVGLSQLGFSLGSAQSIDKNYFTIMSYDSSGLAHTPMIFDVIALQLAYGEGLGTTGSSDDTIKPGTTGFRTYFDSAGVDTIDCSNYVNGAYINLGVNIEGAPHLVGVLMSGQDGVKISSGQDPAALRWLYGEFENAIGSTNSDYMLGSPLPNRISGGEGNDYIDGLGGNDTLTGGAGIDTFKISAGQDEITDLGQGGQDKLIVDAGATVNAVIASPWVATGETLNRGRVILTSPGLNVDLSAITLGTSGYEVKNSSTQGVTFIGSPLSDTLTGGSGPDSLSGGKGDDRIDGGNGNDSINGGDGNDSLFGGAGNDIFDFEPNSRGGSDVFYGGTGDDTYTFDSPQDRVVELPGEGWDLIWVSFDYSLTAVDNVEAIGGFGPRGLSLGGSSRANAIFGTEAADTVSAGGGDDYIRGAGGNDIIDGGPDTDTALMAGKLRDYRVAVNGGNIIVTDTVAARDGVDTLKSIEHIQFADFEINAAIKSFAATIPVATVQSVIELYVAFFNRIPDADGLQFWLGQAKAGMTIDRMADLFYSSGVAISNLSGYSDSMSNADFINVIYRNVLGRTEGADPEGLAYWRTELESGRASRGTLVNTILFCGHDLKGKKEYGWVADLLDNKIAVAKKIAVDWGINYLSTDQAVSVGTALAKAVTSTDTAVAISLIGIPLEAINL